MTESTANATLGAKRPVKTPIWLGWTIAVIFGLFFAFDFWEALGNFIGMSLGASQLGVGLNGKGYAVLIVGLLVPLLCFVAALLVSRRANPLVKVAVFLIALCVSAAISLDVSLVFDPNTFFNLS